MKLLLILATATTLAAAAGSRSYHSRNNRGELDRGRRANLDYEDIETADQEDTQEFDRPSPTASRKSTRIGVYAGVPSLQTAKNKANRRLPKVKDTEASGTHFDGTVYGTHFLQHQHQHQHPQIQQIHTHELLTQQGLVPIFQHQAAPPSHGNLVLTGGLGGLAGGAHHHQPQILIAGGGGAPPGLIAAGPPVAQAVAPGPPENDLSSDITKSVYVFSAPPDPFDLAPRTQITKVPQRHQKHYQVLFINSPTAPQAQHHVELPPPPELKTLVYVLVKKPQPPPPINFIKSQVPAHLSDKPEVYFIRYKNRGHGLSPSPVGPPVDGGIPLGHPGLQYAHAPVASQEQIAFAPHGHGGVPVQAHYEAASQHHPTFALQPQLNPYHHHQEDSQLAASHLLRGPNREVDAGVAGI